MSRVVRPLVASDYEQVRPMLIDMRFVDDEAALAERFPRFCLSPEWALLGAFEDETLLRYAALQDYGPYLQAGNSHRTAKLNDLYTAPTARRRGVGRILMQVAEAWGKARGLRYLFWYANLREATPAYVGMGYAAGEEVQEGYRFFEIDFWGGRHPHSCSGKTLLIFRVQYA